MIRRARLVRHIKRLLAADKAIPLDLYLRATDMGIDVLSLL